MWLLLIGADADFAQVWALDVSADGSFVLSGGHDRSLRIWRRTDEMVFLEEERERELEGLFEAELGRDDVGANGFLPPLKPVDEFEGKGVRVSYDIFYISKRSRYI